MSRGEVLHYSEKIGYCFIRPDDGDESIFVHRSSIASIGESESLEPGDEVTYKTDRTAASQSRPAIPLDRT